MVAAACAALEATGEPMPLAYRLLVPSSLALGWALLGPTVEDPKPLSAIQSTVVRPALDTETHAPWSLRAVMRKAWLGFHPLMQTRFRAYVEKSQEEVLELLAEDERAVVQDRL